MANSSLAEPVLGLPGARESYPGLPRPRTSSLCVQFDGHRAVRGGNPDRQPGLLEVEVAAGDGDLRGVLPAPAEVHLDPVFALDDPLQFLPVRPQGADLGERAVRADRPAGPPGRLAGGGLEAD